MGIAGSQSAPTIVTRAEWGAKPASQTMKSHQPVFITIHHTASAGNPRHSLAQKLRSLQNFSQSNARLADGRLKIAWADVPYHFYIAIDGSIGEGRHVRLVGDTNTRYDPTGHIGIVVEGSFDIAEPTKEQLSSLARLTRHLAALHGVKPENIRGHRDHAQTACPGRTLQAYLPELRKLAAQ
jgi:hypothetical protein